jgi:sarcosine oxidase
MRVDSVVIGAGAIGSATAWWLSRSGRSVVLAEQFAAGHDRGSSHGAVRIFRYSYDHPEMVAMAQVSLPLWRALEDECGEVLVDQCGVVDHGAAPVIDRLADAMASRGAVTERLQPAAAAERFPGLRFDEAVLFHPGGGRAFADRAVAALQRRAAAWGADVRFESPARIVAVRGDGVEVDIAGETVAAGCVVVTAGAWVDAVLGPVDAGALPPFTVTDEQVVHFPLRGASGPWPSFIHHRDGHGAAGYGLLSIDEGVKVGLHHDGEVTTVGARIAGIDDVRLERTTTYAERWLPGVEPTPQFPSRCLYTTTPDQGFVVERRGRVVIGSACSGHGFKFTPFTGRRLAELAMAPEP